MIETTIRTMKDHELKNIYKHIERDFLEGEYAPYGILHQQLKSGIQTGFIFNIGKEEAAYSICAENTNGYVLISLFAVFEKFRGQGVGSSFLNGLCKIYSEKKGLIVEVEKPENSQIEEQRFIREKRIEFYRKAGFSLIHNIDYSIWNVPMHLMMRPDSSAGLITGHEMGKIMYEIYLNLMGQSYIHKMVFKTTN